MSEVGFGQSAAFYPTKTLQGVLAAAILETADFQISNENPSVCRRIIKGPT
jgi:hypothetical protein